MLEIRINRFAKPYENEFFSSLYYNQDIELIDFFIKI